MLQIKEQYIINDKGQPTSVIITKKNYDRLVEYIEELEDIAAYDKAKHERSKAVPWDMVKRWNVLHRNNPVSYQGLQKNTTSRC